MLPSRQSWTACRDMACCSRRQALAGPGWSPGLELYLLLLLLFSRAKEKNLGLELMKQALYHFGSLNKNGLPQGVTIIKSWSGCDLVGVEVCDCEGRL